MSHKKPSELVVFRQNPADFRFIKKDLTAMDIKAHGYVSFTIHKEGQSVSFTLNFEDVDLFTSSLLEAIQYGKSLNK